VADHHTELLDKVLDKNAHLLPEDLRIIFHALRNEAQETRLVRLLSEERLKTMEKLLSDHIKSCDMNRDQMDTLIKTTKALEGSMIVANWMKRLVIWFAGLAGAAYSLWKLWKGSE